MPTQLERLIAEHNRKVQQEVRNNAQLSEQQLSSFEALVQRGIRAFDYLVADRAFNESVAVASRRTHLIYEAFPLGRHRIRLSNTTQRRVVVQPEQDLLDPNAKNPKKRFVSLGFDVVVPTDLVDISDGYYHTGNSHFVGRVALAINNLVPIAGNYEPVEAFALFAEEIGATALRDSA